MSTLKYQITLMQGGVEATFKLNEREYQYAKTSVERDEWRDTVWFTWARYYLSPAKASRFYRLFKYGPIFYAYNCGPIEK